MKLNGFKLGDLSVDVPIVQGGMGVGISLSGLASAVASHGGIGVISSAQIGFNMDEFATNPLKTNLSALTQQLKIARQKSKGGVIGVNIMCALKGYEEYVKCSVENGADIIISGAGLPVNLPEIVANCTTKIAPIISSFKGINILLKMWAKRYNRTADMIVIEGVKAGGHLGFTEVQATEVLPFDDEIRNILSCVNGYEEIFNKKIPVVFGGGVFDNSDVSHYLELGCSGVQVASRFVATEECDVHENFKLAYVNACEEDIGIIKSPVGMPGRAIINDFIRRVSNKREDISKCYSCLNHCDIKTTPYCITKALINSAKGDVNNGLIFCNSEAYRIKEITTVERLIKELTS